MPAVGAERLARHEKADSAYLDRGVRLVDVAGWAAELYDKYGLLERRGFLASILQDVTLKDGILRAEYRPAFRVLGQMTAEPTPPPNVRGGGSRSSKLTVWGPYGDEFRTVLRSTQAGSLML